MTPRKRPRKPAPVVAPRCLAEMPDVLVVGEAAEVLRISERQVRKMVGTGDLDHFRIGSEIRFRNIALAEWIERQAKRVRMV